MENKEIGLKDGAKAGVLVATRLMGHSFRNVRGGLIAITNVDLSSGSCFICETNDFELMHQDN